MTSNYVVVNATVQTMPNARVAELMTAVLTRGVPFRFQASGVSMSPFIHDNDVITIAPAPTRIAPAMWWHSKIHAMIGSPCIGSSTLTATAI